MFALLSSWAPTASAARIASLSIEDFLRRNERADRSGQPVPTMIAIDQAERLFQDSEIHISRRRRFLDELIEAMNRRPAARLLLCVRTDHLDDVLPIAKEVADDSCVSFPLEPFGQDTAIEAARGPIERFGRALPPEIASLLVDELRTVRTAQGTDRGRTALVEPVLLQVVCARLWRDLTDAPEVHSTRLHLDVNRALQHFTAQALANVAADQQLPPHELASWLRNTFISAASKGGGTAQEGSGRAFGLPAAVVQAVEDEHVIKARWRNGLRGYELQHPRLVQPVQQLEAAQWHSAELDGPSRLRAAEEALSRGRLTLARRHADEAASAASREDTRTRAQAESFLGTVAYEQGLLEEAARRYRSAAGIFETLGDTTAVGQLLAAVGRLKLVQGGQGAGVEELSAAANRVPNDLSVQTGLGQALWNAGRKEAALVVLGEVLRRDGDTPEALRVRGEIYADLGKAESALRDLDRVANRAVPSARAARALALATLSRTEAARKELGDLVTDTVESGPVLFRAARVQKLSGNRSAALQLATRALSAKRPPLPSHQRSAAVQLIEEL
ncbi:tetratricopeptide (TPR) repeat protein [Nonomuraea thailandensis]|uniref:Tetratricopeptide (TPR) repeat protein n=1 Tax=Nonomuraea thailandensis TaxID=1188745 RepID=A0A9X2GRJ0_9ACTN|nr:hypothetical protein [Nonomuraea thailandensis]MCP2362592.1 tetratricopeptide (TPR) repeat protein [Nonomuraea thailandensis]